MREIDLETYPRRSHYEYFKSMAYPYVGVAANVEVTALLKYAKDRNGSVFFACLWAAAQAANRVPQLRQRIVGDKILEFEHCNTGHTVAMADNTFCSCTTDCRMPLAEFLKDARVRQEAAKQRHGFADADEPGDIFVSCVPWIAFTQCIQPSPIPADSNPRIVFGKFFQEGEKTLMPLHIQCNHALVDGYHLGQFYQEFESIERDVKNGRI